MWKVSQFTVVRNLGERGLPGHHLIFNTASSRCLTVQVEDWDRITGHLHAPAHAPEDVQRAIERLVSWKLLVPGDEDPRQAFERGFDAMRHHPARIFPLLAVTSACNIACTYCYEDGIQGKSMTPDVVQGCLRWMERRIVRDGIREIHPGLFGGEPLIRPDILFAIMDGFAALVQRHGIRGSFHTSSNGVLLTDALARDLAARGLEQIQISLDGPEHIHDKRRKGHKGQPSFAQSLRAIHTAVAHIRNVTVKVNFDRQNRAFLAALFDRLLAEGLGDRVNVKLEAIAYQLPDSKVEHSRSYPIPPESVEMADAYVQLMLEARERGLDVSHDTAHTTPCMFSSNHGVIIGPEGEIYKCISLIGRKEFQVGTVFDEDYDQVEYAKQMNTAKRLVECYEEACPYIPVCAGGCAYESAVRTGRYDLRFCTREYLAEFHFKRHLLRFRAQLEALGMRPLDPEELASTGVHAADTGHGPDPELIPMARLMRRRTPAEAHA